MDASYKPKPTAEYDIKHVELKLQALAYRIPPEWCLKVYHDVYLDEIVVNLERLVAELDRESKDIEHGYETFVYSVRTLVAPIDHLKYWLVKTFPLMTAPAWQPRWYNAEQMGTFPLYKVKQTIVNKVVAPTSTQRYRYVGR